jgi:hypothetical protein
MCHGRDWRMFEELRQKKAEDVPAAQDRRAEVIETLLSEAKKQGEGAKPAAVPVREAAPAK